MAAAATDARDVPDLVAAVERAAARWPDRVAWTFDPGDELTFRDVADRSRSLAVALHAAGVSTGDAVGVMAGNTCWQPLCWLALARLGAVCVALNPRYGAVDLDHVLGAAGCRIVLTTSHHLARAGGGDVTVLDVEDLPLQATTQDEPWPTIGPDTVVNVQFTSGTSGYPKGCVLDHRYWMTLAASLVREFPHLDDDDVLLTAQAFHYIDPMWNVAAGLLAGARLVVLDGFHPSSFWRSAAHHDVTYVYCLGAMPRLMLAVPPQSSDRSHRVRVVQCSAIPPRRHAELETRFGVSWFEAFGMTETGADLRVVPSDHDALVGSGCVGGPAAHRQVRIQDHAGQAVPAGETGELVLRVPG